MTIPADIREKAEQAWRDAIAGSPNVIARAILEERERCAQIAENAVDFNDDGLSTFDATQIIASAIRNEGEWKT